MAMVGLSVTTPVGRCWTFAGPRKSTRHKAQGAKQKAKDDFRFSIFDFSSRTITHHSLRSESSRRANRARINEAPCQAFPRHFHDLAYLMLPV